MATCNPTELLAAGKCFDCLDEGLKQTIKLQLLCEIANGSGDSGITSLTGDVTATGPGAAAATIAARAVTFAKLQAISTSRVLGRLTAGSGDVEELTITGTGNVVFSASPTLTGTALAEALTMSGRLINSVNGALSAPAFSVTGTPITGGTSTTTKPLALIETAGATSAAWITSGTMLGVNAPSGFAGDLINAQVSGALKFRVGSGGVVYTPYLDLSVSTATIRLNSDTYITTAGAANLRLGAADAAAPVAQTISVQNVVAGTANTAGVNWTINGSRSTGSAVGGSIIFQTTPAGGAGSSQNALVAALTIAADAASTVTFGGLMRLKGYTVATLPAAGTAGRMAYVTDATAPTYRGALVGGGAVVCPVFDNGASWESH